MFNPQALVAILIFLVGGLANIIWLLVNLRIENKLLKQLDSLKTWMQDTFTTTAMADAKIDKALAVADERLAKARELTDERFSGMLRRLDILEDRQPLRRVNGAPAA
jgi:hypothetical protein